MWIMTQNGEELVNMDNICEIGIVDNGLIQAVQHPNDEYAVDLGQYSSKEKAFEIMDRIAVAFEDNCHIVVQMPPDGISSPGYYPFQHD